VKRAIRIHSRDFAAILSLVVMAITVVGYILLHQPAFSFNQSNYAVQAAFQTGAAVTAGQGQSVDIAGVQVGQVGAVQLQGGRAVVTMNIFKKYAPVYKDATVLLRPRTPLKDMYLALDRGTPAAGAIPNGGMLPVASTSPDIDLDQILSSLDGDSRTYLLLLLSGGAQALQDPGAKGTAPSPAAVAALRGTFKRFAPLNRDTQTFASLLATRQRNISRAIHGLQLVATSLGSVDDRLTSLIDSSNTNFSAISSQDANLQSALTLLPGTLAQTTQTLGKVQAFAAQSGPALHQLLPFARAFGPALSAARPLFHDTTPVIRDQLRPFSIAVQPLARILRPAASGLARATPHLSKAIGVLNALFNTLAYQPHGQQGYLFWGAWLSHLTASITSTQDAQGPILRGSFLANCADLENFENGIRISSPSVGPLLDLVNPPNFLNLPKQFCPPR
jgi:phospholipid/cholesterol/gamma-HCH transport system substrate-binding protein